MIHHYCKNITEFFNRTDPLPPYDYAKINLFLYIKRPAEPADLDTKCIIERELDKVLIRNIKGWIEYFAWLPRKPIVPSIIIADIIGNLSNALANVNTTKWDSEIERCVKHLCMQYDQRAVEDIVQREITLFTKDLNISKILEDEMNIKGIQ